MSACLHSRGAVIARPTQAGRRWCRWKVTCLDCGQDVREPAAFWRDLLVRVTTAWRWHRKPRLRRRR